MLFVTRGRVTKAHCEKGLRSANTWKQGEQKRSARAGGKRGCRRGARCLLESGAMPLVGTLAHDLKADDKLGSYRWDEKRASRPINAGRAVRGAIKGRQAMVF